MASDSLASAAAPGRDLPQTLGMLRGMVLTTATGICFPDELEQPFLAESGPSFHVISSRLNDRFREKRTFDMASQILDT